MFTRTRLRLTLIYVGLSALVLGAFSLVFYFGISTALTPTFDLGPELTTAQAAEVAYRSAVDQIRVALILANLVALAFLAVGGWLMASLTLAPIREAYARQRRFVADASHEMRTPLAAMRATLEGAMAATLSLDEMHDSLETVVQAAERLARLTNDLLLLARTNEMPPDRERVPVDLSVLVAETVEAYAAGRPDLDRPRASFTEDLPVVVDPDEVGRIVSNLLDNAFRYGGVHEPPRITTGMADREAVVEVLDLGPGIARADLSRIFEPFARLRADGGATPGSGLGLAIARSLAIRNGGRLSVTSVPGAGTTFSLALPLLR